MIIGEVINSRYEIKMLIGDGGMANVYLAYDRILRKNVAIKMLRFELSKDESFIKRFNREADQVTNLDHPNIVKSYAIGEYKEQPFIVMEYIKGQTLKDYLRDEAPLTPDDVTNIMIQICKGTRYAHHEGAIHRDLKSQNIMIDENQKVKIADFGIALSSNESDMTQTNTIMGSVHYLAPELARGSLATKASDIYALGVLLYELLTGNVPFKGESAVNVALQHMESNFPSVTEANEDLSKNFDLIIQKATHKRAANRYEDVAAMIEDLENVHLEGAIQEVDNVDLEKTQVIQMDEEIEKVEPMPKKKKRRRIGFFSIINAILLTVILAIAIPVYYQLVIYPTHFETEQAIFPDVIGLDADEAKAKIEAAGFSIEHVTYREVVNTTVEEGAVFRSEPPGNIRIRILEDMEIILYSALP